MFTDIFISHSRSDNVWCDEFVRVLRQSGADAWYDQHGEYAGWAQTIQRIMQSKKIFIVILSQDAWISEWVREEIDFAFSFHKIIIGLIMGTVDLKGEILNQQLVDVTNMQAKDAAILLATQFGLREPSAHA